MINFRIIPKLEIKNENLVKGVNHEGLRVLGDPLIFISEYLENNADEIFLQDVTASLYETKISPNFIDEILKKTFVPVLFGGGISSIDDVSLLLKLGIDRFSINTAALKKPEIINHISNKIGSANLAISVECKKIKDQYFAYGEMGRYNSGKKIEDWIDEIISRGAGEIIINSIDNDGTGKGLDEELIKRINRNISIPLIISGGVGKKEDILNLIENYDFSAISIASILHYNIISKDYKLSNTSIGNKNFIKSLNKKKNIETCSLKDIKSFLKSSIKKKNLVNLI